MQSPSPIKEDLLQYVWKTKRFDMDNLVSTSGQKIEIKQFGFQNTNAGPDFKDARIIINGIEWAGQVEMHVLSSQWYHHRHHEDDAYNGVILHVVYEHDQEVTLRDGTVIPTLEMKNMIDQKLQANYLQLINNQYWIPCQSIFPELSIPFLHMWMTNLMVERLERKTDFIRELQKASIENWDKIAFIMLSKYLGSQVNGLPMEMLARQLDYRIILKNNDDLLRLEALLFGQAGLLRSGFRDDYPNKLKTEYRFLRKKYDLQPMEASIWKFGRIRPVNFPTIRIAQLAGFLYRRTTFFRDLMNSTDLQSLEKWLQLEPSDYWLTHYKFDQESKPKKKLISKNQLHLININVVAPLFFAYGKAMGKEYPADKAIALLESIPAEKNSIVQNWRDLGVNAFNAEQSQALIQLKNEYCQKVRCLECRIGHYIIKQ